MGSWTYLQSLMAGLCYRGEWVGPAGPIGIIIIYNHMVHILSDVIS